MDSKIDINEYIKADVVSDILSQSIANARQKLLEKDTEENRSLLNKLLEYNKEFLQGNKEIVDKVLKGEI